jgi:hypothetical protein
VAVGILATSALVIGVGVGPAGALDQLPGPWHRDGATEARPTADRDDSAEDGTCTATAAPAPTTTAPTAVRGSSLDETITVVVPPLVRVQSDDAGVLSVVTNANRPPAPGDLVYVLQPNGDYDPADDAFVTRVMSAQWADGSWCSTRAEHRSVG